MVSSITTMRKGISSPQCRVPPGFCRNWSKRTNFLTSTNLMWGRHKSGVEASTNLAVHTNLLLVCINHPYFRKHPNRRQLEPNKHDNLLVSKTTVDLVNMNMNKTQGFSEECIKVTNTYLQFLTIWWLNFVLLIQCLL